jgi:hypothetical protein
MEDRVIWIFCLRFKAFVAVAGEGEGEIVDQQPMRYDISGLTIYAVDSFVLLFLMFSFFFSCTSTNN